jgi:hypothetical protein
MGAPPGVREASRARAPVTRVCPADAMRGQGEAHAANASTWKYWQSAAEQDAKRRGTEQHGRRRSPGAVAPGRGGSHGVDKHQRTLPRYRGD